MGLPGIGSSTGNNRVPLYSWELYREFPLGIEDADFFHYPQVSNIYARRKSARIMLLPQKLQEAQVFWDGGFFLVRLKSVAGFMEFKSFGDCYMTNQQPNKQKMPRVTWKRDFLKESRELP